VFADTRLEMLPVTECPGLTVTVLEVSFDTNDSGRGMNSTVSANPTRARTAGSIVAFVSPPNLESATELGAAECSFVLMGSAGVVMIVGLGSGGRFLWSNLAGLEGALSPLKLGVRFGGCSMIDRS
jgi:hypothetical protein